MHFTELTVLAVALTCPVNDDRKIKAFKAWLEEPDDMGSLEPIDERNLTETTRLSSNGIRRLRFAIWSTTTTAHCYQDKSQKDLDRTIVRDWEGAKKAEEAKKVKEADEMDTSL